MIRWLRRRLGIADLEARLDKLEGAEPSWSKVGGEGEKQREVAARFEPREPGVPRPSPPSEGLGWRRQPADAEEVPEIRRHGGAYL